MNDAASSLMFSSSAAPNVAKDESYDPLNHQQLMSAEESKAAGRLESLAVCKDEGSESVILSQNLDKPDSSIFKQTRGMK